MKKIFIITAVAALALSSCSGFLDINQNPNAMKEDDVTVDMIMPAAEINLATTYGNYFRFTGGYFAEHYAQFFGTSNYLPYSRFTATATSSSSSYSQLYTRCLNNLEVIRKKASAAEEWGTYLAATTLRTFAFQVLVDCYGETPYTEAFDYTNTSPRYDDGKDIYEKILADLDEALSKAKKTDRVCVNFLFPDAAADKWIRFANALKLKLLMRVSGVTGFTASSSLDDLVTEDNFPTESVRWDVYKVDEKGKSNPFYQEEFATYFGSTQTNVGLNAALLNTMKVDASSFEDPRLAKYFKQNNSSAYWGGVSGTNFSTTNTYKESYFCRPNVKFSDPVSLISLAEINFLLSEYHASKSNATDAENYYEAAIKASCADAGLTDTDAATIIAQYPWDGTNYQKCIGIQKWVDLAGYNSFEAWCELRRLGYPAFGTTKGSDITDEIDQYNLSSLVPGELYTPVKYDSQVGENKPLQRFPYAESSTSRNSNAPATKPGSAKIFWAK